MADFRWTKGTLLFTMLAVVIALISLSLEWYACDVQYIPGTTWEYSFHVGYSEGSDAESLAEAVGGLITAVAMMIVLWAFVSIWYLSVVYEDEPAFYLGWVMVYLALAPVIVYALFVQSVAENSTSGTVDSKLTLGPVIALVAGTVQTAAVAVRNAQVLNPELSGRALERKQEETGVGDLPER